MANKEEPREVRFSGGMNNLNLPLDLYLRKKGEVSILRNADLSLPGVISPLKGLLPLNGTAGSNIHSAFVGNNVPFVVDDNLLRYLDGSVFTTLWNLASREKMRWAQAGNWLFISNGVDKKAIYIPDKSVCDWGVPIPTVAPTVAFGVGALDDTYYCYYRYRVTFPDGTLVLTSLSPATEITPSTASIEWSGLTYPTVTGATSVQIDLFRTSATLTETYLVKTLSSPTTSFSDNVLDGAIILLDYYSETGYYPPPTGARIAKYYAAADRVFVTIGGDAYWSEAGQYHIFLYSASAGEYQNVNSVFLAGEDITAIKRIDEHLYFGSQGTWRRLRGRTPSDWAWEDTMAATGPINDESAVESPWGVIHPAADGTMWLFTGNTSRSILDEFIFTVPPRSAAHATFDGRFYRLFYEDPTYPEIVVDFLKYPSVPPRVVQSTRTAKASFYDTKTGEFYTADAQYLRNGSDPDSIVTLTIKTPEIPLAGLLKKGAKSTLNYKANTQGEDLTITPYADGSPLASLVINTATNKRDGTPVPFGDAYTLALLIEITTAAAITIEEPWLIAKDEG